MQLRNGKQMQLRNGKQNITFDVFQTHILGLLCQLERLNNTEDTCNRYQQVYEIYSYMNTHLEDAWKQKTPSSNSRFIFTAYHKSNELIAKLIYKSYYKSKSPQTAIEKQVFIQCIQELFRGSILTRKMIKDTTNNGCSIDYKNNNLIYKCYQHIEKSTLSSEYDLEMYPTLDVSEYANLYDDYFNKNQRFRNVTDDIFIREFNDLFQS